MKKIFCELNVYINKQINGKIIKTFKEIKEDNKLAG